MKHQIDQYACGHKFLHSENDPFPDLGSELVQYPHPCPICEARATIADIRNTVTDPELADRLRNLSYRLWVAL